MEFIHDFRQHYEAQGGHSQKIGIGLNRSRGRGALFVPKHIKRR